MKLPQDPRLLDALRIYFWSHVTVGEGEADACWPWPARRNPRNGYGQFDLWGKRVGAHRLAYALLHGPIPKGIVIRHKCDNPPCVNPAHLIQGTRRDNYQDALDRGRITTRAATLARQRLTDSQIRDIRRRRRWGEKQWSLAHFYDVSQSHIHKIVTYKRRASAGDW